MSNQRPVETKLALAFQPVVEVASARTLAVQAIVSGSDGRDFDTLLAALPHDGRHALDQRRNHLILAHAAAAVVDRDALIVVPLRAAAGRARELLAQLCRAALANGLPLNRLVVEVSADERGDFAAVAQLVEACTARGLAVSLDRFSAGPIGMKLLARFTPRFVRLDRALVRAIQGSAPRRQMLASVLRLARGMGVQVIAPGIDSRDELAALYAMGVPCMQGDWIAPAQRCAAALEPHRQMELPLRREPRGAVTTPTHRRLAHHARLAPARPLPAAPAQALYAL